MRYVRFARKGAGESYGLVEGTEVVDLSAMYGSARETIAALRSGIDPSGLADAPRIPLREIRFLPPIDNGRYFCVGNNYRAHISEMKVQSTPLTIFLRNPASVVGHNEALVHGDATSCYDFEGELAVVIGAFGSAKTASEALAMVAGYTCLMDGSARDVQKQSVGAGKNFDSSGAIGPWVCSARGIADPQNLCIETRVNGERMQHENTSCMIATVADVIIYISSFAALQPGDVISTGTPSGVGMSRSPPRWLLPGDRIEVEISSIGTLANEVTRVGGNRPKGGGGQ